jgi:hypothetical protein
MGRRKERCVHYLNQAEERGQGWEGVQYHAPVRAWRSVAFGVGGKGARGIASHTWFFRGFAVVIREA